MLNSLSNADLRAMAEMADGAIASCLIHAANSRSKLGEVAAVEAVVTQGMRDVAQCWRGFGSLPLRNLCLQTVFCHSAPKVTFTRPGSGGSGCCELADLLLVVDDLSAPSPVERRRAVLIQAKLQHPPGHLHLNNNNERVQFELLSEWPSFTFNAGFYRPHARDVSYGPDSPECGGEYGGIDQSPPGPWTQYRITTPCFAPSPPVHGAVALGRLVAYMLAGYPGYGRSTIPDGPDPWSETVQELLDVTFGLPIRLTQPKSRRGNAHTLNFSRHLGADAEWRPKAALGPPSSPTDDGDEWPDGAISVVRFVINEPERSP
jgi:hypothetical protein